MQSQFTTPNLVLLTPSPTHTHTHMCSIITSDDALNHQANGQEIPYKGSQDF